jgi:hypothetical protein
MSSQGFAALPANAFEQKKKPAPFDAGSMI